MNEFIENHGKYEAPEFMRLVNEKLAKAAPSINPLTIEDVMLLHEQFGLSIDTVVEEQLALWKTYG
jgi:hypothetical protein